MIDNDFVYELGIDWNLNEFRRIVSANHLPVPGLQGHQRLVSASEYMTSLQKKFPFLSNLYNIYRTTPGDSISSIVPHIDARRKCAINVPIENTEDSFTIFSDCVGEPKLKFVPEFVYHRIESELIEKFRFTLSQPTLINNSVPHSVELNSNKIRVILSWSISDNYDFQDIKNLLKQN
jgi:hypothetical protein